MSDIADVPRGLLTLEQWDALELDPTRRWELSEGTLIMTPRPIPHHQRILKRLIRLLDDHLPDGLEALPEIEVTTSASFPPSVRDPDIVVVRGALSEHTARVAAADVVLVVEIVSPGSRRMDHVMKLHEYAKAAGIEHYWIVDADAATPDDRFLAYRLAGETYRRVAAVDGDWVRVGEPATMEFRMAALTGR